MDQPDIPSIILLERAPASTVNIPSPAECWPANPQGLDLAHLKIEWLSHVHGTRIALDEVDLIDTLGHLAVSTTTLASLTPANDNRVGNRPGCAPSRRHTSGRVRLYASVRTTSSPAAWGSRL